MINYIFYAKGTPKAQPRPRATRIGKHARVYNPSTTDAWKAAITREATPFIEEQGTINGAVRVSMVFMISRPKSHFGTGKNSEVLKQAAATEHVCKPDVDNLIKPVLDALTKAGAWADDCQVVKLAVYKKYTSDQSGCIVEINQM